MFTPACRYPISNHIIQTLSDFEMSIIYLFSVFRIFTKLLYANSDNLDLTNYTLKQITFLTLYIFIFISDVLIGKTLSVFFEIHWDTLVTLKQNKFSRNYYKKLNLYFYIFPVIFNFILLLHFHFWIMYRVLLKPHYWPSYTYTFWNLWQRRLLSEVEFRQYLLTHLSVDHYHFTNLI